MQEVLVGFDSKLSKKFEVNQRWGPAQGWGDELVNVEPLFVKIDSVARLNSRCPLYADFIT